MSEIGQKRKWPRKNGMSVLPSGGDIVRRLSHIRFSPIANRRLMHRSKWHFYSISSSARPLSASGTEMPSALAVLRLIISCTLVALWTGRSLGLAPLRAFPV
jgi:hypothetical protein